MPCRSVIDPHRRGETLRVYDGMARKMRFVLEIHDGGPRPIVMITTFTL